jgi:peptide/nickel transport system substrate-binding protein
MAHKDVARRSGQRLGAMLRGALLAGMVIGGAVSAVVAPANPALAAEQVLRVAHPKFDMDWSPLRGGGVYYRWNSFWWATPMYFDDKGEIHPYVFTKWTSSADGSQWDFEIDPKAKFSDGSLITAASVKGSWELAAVPSTKHQRVDQVLSGVVGYQSVSSGRGAAMEGLVVTGDHSLRVHLSAPDPIFFMKIANALVPVVKPEQARGADGQEVSEWWHPDNKVVVSGPFMPVKMDLDSGEIVFERNPNFFGPVPKLERVEIRSVEDSITATAMLQKGEADAHTELATPTMIDDLGEDFAAGPLIPKGQHFWMHVNRAPTNDINVRKALIMAIDRDGLLKATFPKGPHQKAGQILNAIAGVDPNYKDFPFNPEEARKALAASSYGGPDRLPKLMLVGISTPANEAAAQYIAEQWRQNLGITAVEMKPQIDSYAGPDQGNVQIFRDDVGTRVPDAVAYLMGSIHSGSSNAKNKLGGYQNSTVDRLLEDAATLPVDDPDRILLAQQAQKTFRDEWAFIPWYYEAMSKWATPRVQGMVKNLDWQVFEPWNVSIKD